MVKTMYPKIVTEKIIEYQALGFSGEETREALQGKIGIHPCLNTIYAHRHSPIGIEMLHELIRHQERDILKADVDAKGLAMKYRQKMIEFIGDRVCPPVLREEIRSEHTETQRVLHLHLWKPEVNAEP